uniref:Conserved plasma membrane protein n=1 Tax=Strongyloides papillosus TaxID=174720 RepID=A0A0N5B9A7_STREA
MYSSAYLENFFYQSANSHFVKKRKSLLLTTTDGLISSEEVEMNEKGDYENATDLLEYLVPIFFVMILILWGLKWIFHCYTKSRCTDQEGTHRIGSSVTTNVNRVYPTSTEDPYFNARTYAQMYGQYGGIFFQPTPPKYDDIGREIEEAPQNDEISTGPPPYPRTPSNGSVRELRVESLTAPPTYCIEEVSDV